MCVSVCQCLPAHICPANKCVLVASAIGRVRRCAVAIFASSAQTIHRLVPASTPYPCLDPVRFPKPTLGVTIASSVIRSLAITPTPSKTNLPTGWQLPRLS